MVDEKLCMKFDMNTIQHLGVKLYSTLPPVLGELVSNSWDADAKNIIISLNDSESNNKNIVIKDDGRGMTFEDINSKFLMVGRNRREEETDVTEGGRKVIGRKGIGKLSIFGIAQEIIITTIKNGVKNKFKMNLPTILKSNEKYYPEHIVSNESTNKENGTIIKLGDRKSVV